MLLTDYNKAAGFLFVGDPHLSSRKPGRRVEAEHEIVYVIVDKFDQAIEIANAQNLVVVVTGDLFDKCKESSALLMTLSLRALRKAIHPVLCLPGNHDLLATDVTDDTALAAVEASGLVQLMTVSNDVNATFMFGGEKVALGSTFHGDTILNDVSALPAVQDAKVVWVTHHDIAFDGAYPGSTDPYDIKGCGLVINGHMHRTQPSIFTGSTWWVNPGNIFRQTIADAKHIPAVWKWTPEMDVPERIPLRIINQVFDWTGKAIAPKMGDLVPVGLDELDESEDAASSLFVSQLSATLSGEMPKSSNADILLEDMAAIKEELKPTDEVLKIVTALHTAIQTTVVP